MYETRSPICRDSNFSSVPKPEELGEEERKLFSRITDIIGEVEDELEESYHLHRALSKIMKISKIGNEYFQEKEPWETIKSDKEECRRTLFVCANIVKSLAILLEPFLPETAEDIWDFLGQDTDIHHENWENCREMDLRGIEINEPEPLFEKRDGGTGTRGGPDSLSGRGRNQQTRKTCTGGKRKGYNSRAQTRTCSKIEEVRK